MKQYQGFSLIELVVALVISSMLVVTLMGLTARLSQSSKKLREFQPTKPWASVLKSQLEKDYRHANSIVVKEKEILIQTTAIPHSFLQHNQESFALQVPLLVTYRVIEVSGEQVLFRTETRLDRSAPGNRLRQAMCQGVYGFSIATALETDVPPGIVELTLHASGEPNKPILDAVLVRHGVLAQ